MVKSNTKPAGGPASEPNNGPGTHTTDSANAKPQDNADLAKASQSQTTAFDKLLLIFKKTQARAMSACWDAAKIAMQHFHDHGNVSLLQRLHDAMDENFSRRAAFLKWAGENSPLAMEKGLFMKDKTANARPFNLEVAFAKEFWQYAPAPKITFFTAEGILDQIEGLLTRYEKAAKDMKGNTLPASDKVVPIITALREAVTPLKAQAIRADAQGEAEKKAAELEAERAKEAA